VREETKYGGTALGFNKIERLGSVYYTILRLKERWCIYYRGIHNHTGNGLFSSYVEGIVPGGETYSVPMNGMILFSSENGRSG